MDFLIITGLSGAGKSRAADVLEDLDYYCVDNMPIALMTRFAELCVAAGGRYEKVALVTDVREKGSFDELLTTLDQINSANFRCRILYMDADKRTLVRRYKESRRPHPLAADGLSVEDAIRREEELLKKVKARADFIVDSSSLTLGMLQNRLFSIFSEDGRTRELDISVMSFGYKHGLPMDADLVFDARFLPNPFYVEALRPMCGLDRPVKDYVFSFPQTREFEQMLESMIDYLIPLYIEEGKLTLNITIGCTGGRHRSVAIASALSEHLRAKGTKTALINRDIDK